MSLALNSVRLAKQVPSLNGVKVLRVTKPQHALTQTSVRQFHGIGYGALNKLSSNLTGNTFKPVVLRSFSDYAKSNCYTNDCNGNKFRYRHYGKPWVGFSDIIGEIQDAISKEFSHPRREWSFSRDAFYRDPNAEWRPRADISQDNESYFIHAELAGVKKEDIKVSVEGGELTLSGQRKSEIGEENTVHRQERRIGTFSRTWELPEDADPNQIKASFKDGVLELKINKLAKEKSQTVEVKIDG